LVIKRNLKNWNRVGDVGYAHCNNLQKPKVMVVRELGGSWIGGEKCMQDPEMPQIYEETW